MAEVAVVTGLLVYQVAAAAAQAVTKFQLVVVVFMDKAITEVAMVEEPVVAEVEPDHQESMEIQ